MPTTFQKSLRLLVHPLSIAAMGLMLLNDFVLKPLAPSWWTSKLSDVAGLFFLPFLVACLLAIVAPRRLNERVIGLLSFSLVAIGFGLLKLAPAFNQAFFPTVRALSGLSLRAVADPSDLLALPALLAAAWMWFRPAPRPDAHAAAPVSRWAYLALPICALVLLADAAAPDYGISCLETNNNLLVARASYGRVFTSADGGLNWQTAQGILAQAAAPECYPQSDGWQSVLKAPDGRQYRVNGGKNVELSKDAGATWQPVYQPAPLTEAETSYLKRTRPGNLLLLPGPYAALLDPTSSNLILAMGQEGALIGQPNGAWTWVQVGPYRHDELKELGVSAYSVLLANEIFLAAAAALLWWATAALRLPRNKWYLVLTILGWIGFAAVAFVLQPGMADSSYFGAIVLLGLLVALIWTIGLLSAQAIHHRHAIKGFLRLAVFLPLVFVLVLLPYILWALNIIPIYWVAVLIAGLLWVLSAVLIRPPSPVR